MGITLDRVVYSSQILKLYTEQRALTACVYFQDVAIHCELVSRWMLYPNQLVSVMLLNLFLVVLKLNN